MAVSHFIRYLTNRPYDVKKAPKSHVLPAFPPKTQKKIFFFFFIERDFFLGILVG